METATSSLFFNPSACLYQPARYPPVQTIADFHRMIQGYMPTPVHNLDAVAHELGLARVLMKDESDRFNLPSFKFLGASWATYMEMTRRLNLPSGTPIAALREILESHNFTLFAATDGNHGRAVAHMGAILGIRVQVHVPAGLSDSTIALIHGEGAAIVQSLTNYDGAILEAQAAADLQGETGILIQDFAFGEYQEIPQWIVDGYSTMLVEAEQQLGGIVPDLVVVPVGVGSLAQAVVTYFKHRDSRTRILTVEPETAACLHESLRAGSQVTTATSATIMTGLECGNVSDTAWPILYQGVDASILIDDLSAHSALGRLGDEQGIKVGPCGAATVAALRHLSSAGRAVLGLDRRAVVLLLCTEGPRDYDTPPMR